jgi:hypothetical protein
MRTKIASAALFIPLLAACASSGASAASLTSSDVSLVNAACTEIMGLRSGESYYQMCQESLGNSLAGKIGGEQTVRSTEECRQQGLSEGSAAFSACVLDKQNTEHVSANTSSLQPVHLSYPRDELRSGESYYNVPNAVHWKREQYSCAQLGLTPGSGAFQHCVVSLDAALFPDPN